MKRHSKITDMTLVAMGAVLLTLTAWITIPFAVPFTLQTFGVAFVLYTLGGKRGALSIIVYIALGVIGVPVFSGFNSGVGTLLGATGGYIIGFALWGCLYFALESFFAKKAVLGTTAMYIGLVASYALGTAWYAVMYAEKNILTALAMCVFPYVIPDIIKILIACLVSNRVKIASGI